MTDQTLNHQTEITAAPLKTLLVRIGTFLSGKQSTTPGLDLSPSDRAHPDRGLPASRRLRQDIGVSEEFSRNEALNTVTNMCARNGLPL